MNKTVAWVLSVLFHPLLMPTFLFSVILFYLPDSFITFPPEGRWIILLFVFLATFLLPAIGAYYLYWLGHVRSLSLMDRAERRRPLLFTGGCYALVSYLFYRDEVFDRLFFFVLGIITIQVLMTYIFSLFWKISAHSVGAGGTLGLLVILNSLLADNYLLPLIVFFILIAGAVMSARLALNAHSSEEVYAGFAMGFGFSVGVWLVSY